MAGHSKWANTKHRKTSQDIKRGKVFTKIIRELVTAAKIGGGNPIFNSRLRTVIDKALSHNMTRNNIHKAIARGLGNVEGSNMENIIYEGYGPGGSAVIIDCLSDNRNRITSEVRYAFSKVGGHLSTNGSVSYLFKKKGVLYFSSIYSEDQLMEAALEGKADDMIIHDNGIIEIFTEWEELSKVRDLLESRGFKADTIEFCMITNNTVELDVIATPKLMYLLDMLENYDDVQEVYHNGKFFDESKDKIRSDIVRSISH